MIDDNVYKHVNYDAFAYRYNDRWAIGPVLNSENPWVYRLGMSIFVWENFSFQLMQKPFPK